MGFYLTKNSNARTIPGEVILGVILQREHVTFAELQAYLEQRGYASRGDWQICLGKREHIVLWRGLSEALYLSLQELIAGRRVFMHPASIVTYLVDGACLGLPMATELDASEDVWLPAVLCSFPCRREAA